MFRIQAVGAQEGGVSPLFFAPEHSLGSCWKHEGRGKCGRLYAEHKRLRCQKSKYLTAQFWRGFWFWGRGRIYDTMVRKCPSIHNKSAVVVVIRSRVNYGIIFILVFANHLRLLQRRLLSS